MNPWRRSLSVMVLSSVFALTGIFGYHFVKDIQFARAEKDVQVTREQLKGAEDLAGVFRDVGKVVSPAVVNIEVKKTVSAPRGMNLRRFLPPGAMPELPDMPDLPETPDNSDNQVQVGTGSGVIMDVDGGVGYIVTNNHVAGGAEEMVVTLADGREIKNAKVVGADPKSDLAVIKIQAEHLICGKWGDSDQLQKGDWILAFGSPFGYVGSMTHGIVSALNRQAHILGDMGYENFIQVDAPINPGNSGGPLVNLRGDVVGINTAIASHDGGFQGIGFAIPSSQAKAIYQTLKDKGKVTRGWLGVGIKDVSTDQPLAKSFGYDKTTGVLVEQTFPNTPATGKLKAGDIITALDGKDVDNVERLRNAIAATAPGTDVKLTVFRDGKAQEVTIKIGEQPEEVASMGLRDLKGPAGRGDGGAKVLGMRLNTLTDDMAQRFGVPELKGGALITHVEPKSAAAEAGLAPGDVITKVEKQEIGSAQDVRDALEKVGPGKDIRLYVVSREGSRFVLITPKK